MRYLASLGADEAESSGWSFKGLLDKLKDTAGNLAETAMDSYAEKLKQEMKEKAGVSSPATPTTSSSPSGGYAKYGLLVGIPVAAITLAAVLWRKTN